MKSGNGKIYNREEFITLFAKKGYTKIDSRIILDDMLNTLSEIVIEGNGVRFLDFGTFVTIRIKERAGKGPPNTACDNEAITVPAQTVMKFRPSKALKARIRSNLN